MKRFFFASIIILAPFLLHAQSSSITGTQASKKKTRESFYFSWGYNTEWYTHSNVKVSQPSLDNDYTMQSVQAHDHKGWDDGIFNKQLTIPQYNYRIGYFFNEEKGLAIELNFDHTKYIIKEPQNVHIKGKLSGRTVDTTVNFAESNGFYYYLNNGANFFLINIVKRWHLTADKSQNIKIDVLGKAGIGPVVPHVENELFGKENDPHFQLGGWNVGLEGSIKVTFYKWVYLEYCNKFDYARYSHLHIYGGDVRQAFGTYEMILNLGVTIPKKVKK